MWTPCLPPRVSVVSPAVAAWAGGHALEVKRGNGVGNVLLHHGEHLLLTLKRTNALEGLGDDANVEVVAGAVQVDHLNRGFGDGFEHLCFKPCRLNHALASTFRGFAPSLNLRPNPCGSFSSEFLKDGVHGRRFLNTQPRFHGAGFHIALEALNAASADVEQDAVVLVDLARRHCLQ